MLLLLVGKKKKGRGFQLGCKVERVCEGMDDMGWEDRDLFFNIILFVSVSCERLLLNIDERKES